MRKRKLKWGLSLSLVITITFGITLGVLAAVNGVWFHKEGTSDAYIYPITPTNNPEQWRQYQSRDEMLSALQIPDETLQSMSTDGLIETCLNYPMFSDMFFFNSTLAGFNNVCSHFNGLQELFSRQDVGLKISTLFQNSTFENITNTDTSYALRYHYLCYILASDSILNSMTKDERKILLDSCISKAQEIAENHTDSYSINSTLFVAARIAAKDNPNFIQLMNQEPSIEIFVELGELNQVTPDIVEALIPILIEGE
ncbi:MAG: hypothetical protein LBM60_08785 [Clostridium sp.]|jgi:hypothetical protein|nr:hypothetical protein [Clostridium sp.]